MDSGFLNLLGVMVSIGLAASIPFGATYLFKALATRVERKPGVGDGEIEALRRRIAELEEASFREMEAVSQRVVELEERLDFAERLLPRTDAAGRG
jgi:hypothetical protein